MTGKDIDVPRLRRSTSLAAATTALTVGLTVGLAAADASPGVFGQAGYRNGLICTQGGTSTPLVAWTLSGSDRPAFALGDVTDTSAPAVGPNIASTPLDPKIGPVAAADIAGAARLISTVGASTRTADRVSVAEAAAVIAALGGDAPSAVACLHAGVAGLDAGEAQAQWEQAVRLAGPYRVALTADTARLTLNEPARLTATVSAASGAPVPGLTVRFAAPGATLPRPSARTDAAGAATVPITVPRGSRAGSIVASAAVSAAVGLVEASEAGRTPVVSAGASRTFTGTVTLPILTSAHPVVVPSLDSHLLLPGGQVTGTVAVTGMAGHDGTATLTLYGPLAVPGSGGCAALTDQDWTAAVADQVAAPLATSTAALVGGGPDTVGTFTARPAEPGCYSLAATVATSNARPNVARTSRYSSPAQTLLVLPYTVSTSADHSGVSGPGPLAVTVRLRAVRDSAPTLVGDTRQAGSSALPSTSSASSASSAQHLPGTVGQPSAPAILTEVTGRVYGPRSASFGECPQTGWGGEPVVSPLSATDARRDAVSLRSRPLSGFDCYGYRVSGRVDVGDLGSVAFDLGPDRPEAAVLLLHPTVQIEYPGQGWKGVPIGSASVATVAVHGSLSQPGTLTVRLASPAPGALGCYDGGWTDATLLPVSGPTIRTTGDGTYRVPSPKLPANACYSLVPVFTAAANPAVQASGLAGDMSSIVAANPPAPKVLSVAVTRSAPDQYAHLRRLVTGVTVLVLLGAASLGTFVAAHRAGRRLAALPEEPRWLF